MCEAVAPPTHVQKKEDTMMKEKWRVDDHDEEGMRGMEEKWRVDDHDEEWMRGMEEKWRVDDDEWMRGMEGKW